MLKALFFWMIGRDLRDWCVVDDGCPHRDWAIYEIPMSRVIRSDLVLAANLTMDDARRRASHIRAERMMQELADAGGAHA